MAAHPSRSATGSPLLQGRLQTQARAALADLSTHFLRLGSSGAPGVSLWGGAPGLALVHSVLDDVAPNAGHLALAGSALELTIRRLSRETRVEEGLSGLAGVGWIIARLVESDPEDAEDPCASFDAELIRVLGRARRTRSFDLIIGLVGIGVYALERVARPSGRRLLASVVRRLDAMARRRRPGVAWWSDPGWIPRRLRENPNPELNLGVAHGVPGVIALLGRVACASDVDASTRDTARRLLDGAVVWLLAQELPTRAGGCFATAVGPGLPRDAARLAWCYGDAGIAAALLVAARGAREPVWERTALRIALRAAERPEASADVVDAGLCHGAAGVAHIFHRLYRATGEERLADASRAWFGRALAMRVPGRGVAGFRSYAMDAKRKLGWRTDPGFLTGAGGIALALAAATTEVEPTWDRVLLVS